MTSPSAVGTRLVFATSNPHKLREAAQVVAHLGLQLVGLDEVGVSAPEPVEDATTFAGNAEIKARYYAPLVGEMTLAEDSGLVVDALGGAPGVLSARYAGEVGSRAQRDEANNRKLLRELLGVPRRERAARFVCSLCVVSPEGAVVARAEGLYEGIIAEELRGEGGFGYDPLLYLPDCGRTSAELSPAEKNARSHRGAALKQLATQLPAQLGGVLRRPTT